MITNQAYLFLIFTLNGIIIGILFDAFRILRRTFKTNDVITYLQDLIFWILAGISVLYFIFEFNNGELRMYIFIAIILGLILYMLTLSAYIIKINVAILKFVKTIIIRVFSIILLPFKYLCKLIKKVFLKPISFIFINFRKNTTNFYSKLKLMIKSNKKFKNNSKNIEI